MEMKHLGLFILLCVTLGLFLPAYGEVQPVQGWNIFDSDPCNWVGVTCSGHEVTKLNISGFSIRGFIAEELFQLSALQELVLYGNKLIGPIPASIGSLKYLKILDLSNKELTGLIPSEISNLVSIITINLESNGLTGQLPFKIGNLQNLQDLRLDRNRLHGTIPGAYANALGENKHGFCRLSSLEYADFSYNFLTGRIPKCLEYLPRINFRGNCLSYKDIKRRTDEQCALVPPSNALNIRGAGIQPTKHKAKNPARDSKPAWLLAVEVVTGVTVGSLFLIAVFTFVLGCKSKPSVLNIWKKSRRYEDHMAVYVDSNMLKGVTKYSRQELEVACEDFGNIIGSSSDSLVYKGIMKDGPEIAVISVCVKEENWTGYLELYYQKEVILTQIKNIKMPFSSLRFGQFCNFRPKVYFFASGSKRFEILPFSSGSLSPSIFSPLSPGSDLARPNHENTGKLLGYCIDSSPFTRMLVFEYASNGTLYEHLHYEEGCPLSWSRRMNIIIGIAKGLGYLHTEIEPSFTISELNSSAVYLTEDFSPKLVDFESWKTIVTRSESSALSISHEGDICVLPSSFEERDLDIQGNIYSFGVLLLEIVSGRPSFCKDKGCLVDWMGSVVDPALKYFKDADLKVICEVVSMCIHLRPQDRISMKELCAMLENRIDMSSSSEMKATSLAWAELMLSP